MEGGDSQNKSVSRVRGQLNFLDHKGGGGGGGEVVSRSSFLF